MLGWLYGRLEAIIFYFRCLLDPLYGNVRLVLLLDMCWTGHRRGWRPVFYFRCVLDPLNGDLRFVLLLGVCWTGYRGGWRPVIVFLGVFSTLYEG